jgi:hypothetical protein
MAKRVTVADITHPYYDEKFRDWQKWRYTYEGGQRFIDQFLERFSVRESIDAFRRRKKLTYNPAFAKEAITEVKNAIFQRLVDVVRENGSKTYMSSMKGEAGGIDLVGSSMSSFIGRKILPELLVMSRVGVYVDMPVISGLSLIDSLGKRPYVYIYRAEDIRSWTLDRTNNENEFTNILLRDYVYTYDNETGLPTGLVSRFRRMWLEDGAVQVKFFNEVGTEVDQEGIETTDYQQTLDIPRIPFVIVQLSDSLLADVANYQIALLNIASSDVAYTLQSNFPFYVEQYNPRADSPHLKTAGQAQGGQATDGESSKTEEIRVGTGTGRRYPQGLDQPAFIHPSPEPLQASMQKQEQLKMEIRQLVNLSVASLQPAKLASAESKQADSQGLEDGLSYIGLELENMERKIAQYWAMYEKSTEATVFYPEDYSLKSDADRRADAESLQKIATAIPSTAGKKEVAKRVTKLVLGRHVSTEELDKILTEIDNAPGTNSDPNAIVQDVEIGMLDLKNAALLRGYPADAPEKAAKDHADRLARIAETQSSNVLPNGGSARGVSDGDPESTASGSKEKKASLDTTTDPNVKDKQRGEGKAK